MKCHIWRISLAFGVAWCAGMAALGVLAYSGRGVEFVEVLSSVYPGYSPSPAGVIIGALWGFLSGLVWGALVAAAYNMTFSFGEERKGQF